MRRLLLALAFLAGGIASANAVCPATSAVMKDNAGSTFNMGQVSDSNGNCTSKVDVDTASQLHTDLTAPVPSGNNTIGAVKRTDGTTIVLTDPCQGVTKTYTPINISASGSVRIIVGTATKKTYVCHIDLVTNTANNVLLSEGTGTNCGTGTQGIIGGTTAASGWNFSANGGISLGVGGFAVLQAWNAAGDDVCLNPSASTQLSGMVAWVQQ